MKKCKVCKKPFTPKYLSVQIVCGYECALEFNKEKKAKEWKKEKKKIKEGLKTLSDHLKDVQKIFNQWIRLRDKDLPCISCGRHHQGQYHAGHYRTVGGNPEIRFEPDNCHKQCAPCNNWKSGNIVEYRLSLRNKIGQERLDWLEGHHESKNYSIPELLELKAELKKKIKDLK